jgi:hypothetical protein
MAKDLAKPHSNLSDPRCLSEFLPRSPKFTETLKNLPLWKLSSLLRDPHTMPSVFAPVRRPRRPPPEAGRNPRSCSFRGHTRPTTRRSPRAPRAGAPRALCRTRPPSARQSVRDLPPSCAVPRSGHHAVVTIGRAVPLFKRSPSSSRRPTSLLSFPPRHRGRHRQAAALHRLWATARVSNFPRTRSTTPSHTLPPVRPPLAGARAVAAATAGHRRAPTSATPPPQLRPPPDPRWACGRPRPLPRPGAPPVRGHWPESRRPDGQGPHCEPPLLSRGLSAKLYL